jgi:hypothetical protein
VSKCRQQTGRQMPAKRVSQLRPHPWQGPEVGPEPEVLNVLIEITPFDLMSHEVDKVRGICASTATAIVRPASDAIRIHPADLLRRPRAQAGPGPRRGDGDPLTSAC